MLNIHEDDIRENQFLHRSRFEEYRIQAENTDDFSQYGPYDFSKVEYDTDKKALIKDLGIQIEDIEKIMKSFALLKFDNITTGFVTFENTNLMGWGGFNHALVVHHKESLVIDLWIYNIDMFEPKTLEILLRKLGEKWDLLLYDHLDILVEINDPDQIKNYLIKKNNN